MVLANFCPIAFPLTQTASVSRCAVLWRSPSRELERNFWRSWRGHMSVRRTAAARRASRKGPPPATRHQPPPPAQTASARRCAIGWQSPSRRDLEFLASGGDADSEAVRGGASRSTCRSYLTLIMAYNCCQDCGEDAGHIGPALIQEESSHEEKQGSETEAAPPQPESRNDPGPQ